MSDVPFRIVVFDPPPGVTFRLQSGRSDLVTPTSQSAAKITFDFTLRVDRAADGQLRLLGPFAQGPPAKRFVYINSGKRAGQAGTFWDRRAKVMLAGVNASLVEQATKTGAVIETRIAGTGADGGPACATVPLLGGWRVVAR